MESKQGYSAHADCGELRHEPIVAESVRKNKGITRSIWARIAVRAAKANGLAHPPQVIFASDR